MAKEKKELIVGVNGDLSDNFTTVQKAVLGLQNTLAMCGVILVPILCGLDVSVTLFCAGIGTIIYQFIDKKMVPAFLGGSFAIIAGVSTVVGEMGIPYAQGGILGMAVFYLLFALLLKILGKDRVARVFPPIIVGPIIMVLGLSLASVGVQEAEANWPIAIITFLIAVGVNNFSKGLTRVMTIIIALVGGYLISIPFGLVDFTALKEAAWIGVPSFTLPQFSWRAIALIAPCAIVPCLEHIGDVMAVGTVVGKDFTHEPGLDRSVFACGVSTVLSGCLGGPSLTIHSENTGVLAVTHLYSPTIVRFGALWMALLAFCPKFNALCGSIPQAVLGGVGILLYGMVTSTGIRTLVDHHVDFSQPRNLCIAAAILILGVGGAAISFGSITLSGMAFAAIAGIIGLVLAVDSVFNTAGRVGFSTLSDHLKRRETVYQVIFIMSIAVCLLQIFTNSINNALLWAVLAMLFLINAGYGGGFSTLPVLLDQHFGTKTVSTTHGLTLSAWAFAGLSGNQLASFVVAHAPDQAHRYAALIPVLTGLFALALISISLVKYLGGRNGEGKRSIGA